ncbi:MAG: alpha/beta hydrolase [bacterium]
MNLDDPQLPRWLYLHGLGDHPVAAEPFLRLLRPHGTVWAPDLHGQPGGTPDDLANVALASLPGDWQERGFQVIGHSSGPGGVQVAERTSTCRQVVAGGSFTPTNAAGVGRFAGPDGQRVLLGALAGATDQPPWPTRPTCAGCISRLHPPRRAPGRCLVLRPARFLQLEQLVVYIAGEHGAAADVTALQPVAATHVVPAGTHWVHLDQPAAVAALILQAWRAPG